MLYKVLNALGDGKKLIELLGNDLLGPIDYSWEDLMEFMESSDEVRKNAATRGETRSGQPLDPDRMPGKAWSWMMCQSGFGGDGPRLRDETEGHMQRLRRWGWVFWDEARLEGWGITQDGLLGWLEQGTDSDSIGAGSETSDWKIEGG